MKKRVVIYMDIDTEREGSSAVGMGNPFPEGVDPLPGVESYTVFVNKGSDYGDAMDATAHELGHAVSAIFELPGGMKNDPRPQKEFNSRYDQVNLTLEQADRIWSNERLAWKIAEKIKPDLDKANAKRALDSYLGMYELALERERS